MGCVTGVSMCLTICFLFFRKFPLQCFSVSVRSKQSHQLSSEPLSPPIFITHFILPTSLLLPHCLSPQQLPPRPLNHISHTPLPPYPLQRTSNIPHPLHPLLLPLHLRLLLPARAIPPQILRAQLASLSSHPASASPFRILHTPIPNIPTTRILRRPPIHLDVARARARTLTLTPNRPLDAPPSPSSSTILKL